jgi:UDP-3-O-[3-hydroxymyristoyl] N-acetylglucosamine deacetylase
MKASVRHLVPTELCTALSVNGYQIKTVEHVLAALRGLEVDNVLAEVEGGEMPAMDGSAASFVQLIRAAGLIEQNKIQPMLKITKPIEVGDGHRRVRIEPAETTQISYTISYDHPLIGLQAYEHEWSVTAFEQEIAGARTFAFLKEVEGLWARGLAKGGSLDNTVVLTEDHVLNESGIRFSDEFVRHKVLDLIGDVALLGLPFVGRLIADRSGHALHTRLVERILEQPECWTLLQDDERVAVPLSAVPPHPHLTPAPALHVMPAL